MNVRLQINMLLLQENQRAYSKKFKKMSDRKPFQPQQPNKEAFKNPESVKGKGLKINNEKSAVQPAPQNQSVAFGERAKEINSKNEEFKQRAWELITRFKNMIDDRILPENKSVLSKGIEAETLNKLVSLASEMNEDDNQPESIGSTTLCMLLMKMMLEQRDTINILAYKIDRLEKSHKAENNTDKNERKNIEPNF
jgi:hypothetical protein